MRRSCRSSSTSSWARRGPRPPARLGGLAGRRGDRPAGGGGRRVSADAEPITDIDATAGETLLALNDELEADGVKLAFAELKDPVRDRLRHYGIHDAIGGDRFFPTVGVAVASYLRETGVQWRDWEDRLPVHDR